MATQNQLALGMITQLRVLDPSVSAEVGTPERKIIDTVAQALAENQIDLNALTGAFDLDAKFGDDLDSFLSIFGFGRQTGALSTGYVKFSRTTPSNYTIPIPKGTQVMAPNVSLDGTSNTLTSLVFSTTVYTEIPIGSLSAVVPVRCIQVGVIGNVAAGQITTFARTPVLGVTDVINEVPTTNGADPETDAEFKVRFKNTVFRNLAGTQDQYLALSVATQFTTKANVVGPISRYREYVQVPDVDDTTADPDSGNGGNGVTAGEWTTALSTIPYSKHVYDTIPYYVTNGDTGITAIFYRRDTDFRLNTTDAARDKGDTYRGRLEGDPNVNTDASTDFQPNLTLYNVYSGTDTSVQAFRPKDVVLFEHSYMSSASRNDYDRQLLNCVDVYINGENPTLADAVIARPNGTDNLFSGNSSNKFYFDNFRRIGEPNRRPVQGNVLTGLFWEPVTDLPDTIETDEGTFLKGIHYWAVEDVSDIGGTVRSRGGIEWNPTIPSQGSGDNEDGPYTGPKVTALASDAISILSYLYDRNIVDLQTALEGNKQVTTDVLGHRSTIRRFKLDITVMYTQGVSANSVNDTIRANLQDFFDGQYFGTVIQLSDLLQVIHNTSGVDNVRWSKDILDAQSLTADSEGSARDRVVECDVEGNPLVTPLVDEKVYGSSSPAVTEVQQLYLTGSPTGGTYKLRYQSNTTATIAWNAVGAAITSALSGASIPATVTGGTGTPTDPWIITFSSTGPRSPITVVSNTLTGTSVFNRDFFLRDEELPTLPTNTATTSPTGDEDTLPGLIIRARAQNTWNQL